MRRSHPQAIVDRVVRAVLMLGVVVVALVLAALGCLYAVGILVGSVD